MANNREEAIKPEFLKLYYKLNDITELALNIDERQRKIIDKATNVNNKLEQSIKNDLNDIKLVVSAEETIKNLFQKIDNSKNLIEQIRNKINNLKENYKK
jgi:RNase adaptor protein for sRNA GlmZ degradation